MAVHGALPSRLFMASHQNRQPPHFPIQIFAAASESSCPKFQFFGSKVRTIIGIRNPFHLCHAIQDARSSDQKLGPDIRDLEIGGGDSGGSDGGNGGFGGNNDGNGDSEDGEENTDDEYGPVLSAEEINKELKARGAVLPADLAQAAASIGLRKLILSRYLDFQSAMWPLGAVIRSSSLLRNRVLADPSFLFKVFTEVAIDSGCATFAEVQKRGKDFWNEFELYLSDLLVGIVMDVALVGMLAPFVKLGAHSSATGGVAKILQTFPSSIFEAERLGRKFTLTQRFGAFVYKAAQYGVVGFGCGLVGQGIANSVMAVKRKVKKSEEAEIPIPPVFQTAVLWGVFMALSSNTRYQIINGLEQVVESSIVAKQVPQLAMAFTVGIRFANNIYGGMQFVDWARWTGIQ